MFDAKVKLHTLINLISFIKFESREYESRYFSGSPIVGEILKDLLIQSNSNKEIALAVELNSPFGRTLINSIKWHLEQTDEWVNMEIDDRLEHIMNLAAPYVLEGEVIRSIMTYRDMWGNG